MFFFLGGPIVNTIFKFVLVGRRTKTTNINCYVKPYVWQLVPLEFEFPPHLSPSTSDIKQDVSKCPFSVPPPLPPPFVSVQFSFMKAKS
mmetsp:Transcript_26556/g.39819  ORF Transcript_26556/g.39819 Transcript_26556/m.39819 type:complete len:89 (-) Transcript_26556:508-774(-)